MSVIYSVYVGPYIQCKTTKRPDTIIQCGEEIEVERIEPDCSPLLEDEEFLNVFQPLNGCHVEAVQRDRGIDVWLPNWCDAPGLEFDPRDEFDIRELNPKRLDLDPYRVYAQLDSLPELKPQWRRLRDFYGRENVDFKWGVINTSN